MWIREMRASPASLLRLVPWDHGKPGQGDGGRQGTALRCLSDNRCFIEVVMMNPAHCGTYFAFSCLRPFVYAVLPESQSPPSHLSLGNTSSMSQVHCHFPAVYTVIRQIHFTEPKPCVLSKALFQKKNSGSIVGPKSVSNLHLGVQTLLAPTALWVANF